MTPLEVTCIVRPDLDSPYTAIQKIGGAGWQHTREEAAENITNKTHSYYVQVDNNKVPIFVFYHKDGKRFLRTVSNDTDKDNLLSLVACS